MSRIIDHFLIPALLIFLLLGQLAASLSIPPPTGNYSIGIVQFPLTDHSRLDPSSPKGRAPRRLMLQLRYPTLSPLSHPFAPYFGPLTSAYLAAASNDSANTYANISTNSRAHAPILPAISLPAIFFSHGLGTYNALYTTLLEDLASYGFLVISIDHPYDAAIVEFPDGLVLLDPAIGNATTQQLDGLMDTRVKDTQFVLNTLQRRLPSLVPGANRRFCIKNFGILGHSFGGAAAANVMSEDRRFVGGMNLDGTVYGRAASRGVDGPFVLMGVDGHGLGTDETWGKLWSGLRGWRRAVVVRGAGHRTFEDVGVLAELFGGRLGVEAEVGTIEPRRGMEIVRVWVRNFFEMVLRDGRGELYGGPSEEWPEVEFEG